MLLSYPLVGPNITRFLQLQHAYPYTCFYAAADNIELLRQLAQVSLNMPAPSDIKILIDINMGMNRTGVLPDEAIHFCKQCKERLKGSLLQASTVMTETALIPMSLRAEETSQILTIP